jgi:hypothetical protein
MPYRPASVPLFRDRLLDITTCRDRKILRATVDVDLKRAQNQVGQGHWDLSVSGLADVAQEPKNDDPREPRHREQDPSPEPDQPTDRPQAGQQEQDGWQGDGPQDEQDRKRPVQHRMALLDVDDRR